MTSSQRKSTNAKLTEKATSKNVVRYPLHTKEWILFVLCGLSIITALITFPMMPELVVTHWGADGEPNGYMNPFWGSFIMPFVIVVMFLLLIFIPRADPMRENIEKFRPEFLNFLLLLFLFLYAVQIFMILWNLGFKINIILYIVPLLSIIFYYTGVMLSKAEQNMSIGIRNPWTLKSKLVWDKTHRVTAPLLKVVAGINLLGVLFPRWAFLILIAPLLGVVIFSFIYSYRIYEKEERRKISSKGKITWHKKE
jgi:uncharacterized membrane protein